MAATAPITQDVLTIPRKLPEGPVNIVGMTRDQLRAALIEAHGALVTLAAQAPTYNFDTGLLSVEIGSLLMRAAPASEQAHG